jgi:ribonucleotide reductase beta subunit family protein with ferritin-like domain
MYSKTKMASLAPAHDDGSAAGAATPEASCILLRDDPIMSALPVAPELEHIHAMYKRAEGAFWTVDEVDFAQDRRDWETKLTDEERHFLSMVLAFFSASDIIVNNNLADTFLREFKPFVVRRLLTYQMMMENIHSETYALTIDVLVPDRARKLRLLNALQEVPAVQHKAAWCGRWSDPASASLGERLVAWACVEGIFFSGSFCALFWLKSRNLMPGTTFTNELISRDEGLHRETSVALYHLLPAAMRPSAERVLEIVTSAVAHERDFINHALPENLTGMNAALMGQYIECVADHLLRALGLANHYGSANPFPWMDMISMEGKTNFFEKRVGEYAKAKIARNEGAEDQLAFDDEDF